MASRLRSLCVTAPFLLFPSQIPQVFAADGKACPWREGISQDCANKSGSEPHTCAVADEHCNSSKRKVRTDIGNGYVITCDDGTWKNVPFGGICNQVEWPADNFPVHTTSSTTSTTSSDDSTTDGGTDGGTDSTTDGGTDESNSDEEDESPTEENGTNPCRLNSYFTNCPSAFWSNWGWGGWFSPHWTSCLPYCGSHYQLKPHIHFKHPVCNNGIWTHWAWSCNWGACEWYPSPISSFWDVCEYKPTISRGPKIGSEGGVRGPQIDGDDGASDDGSIGGGSDGCENTERGCAGGGLD